MLALRRDMGRVPGSERLKRKIAAVLMADIAGETTADGGSPAASARLDETRSAVRTAAVQAGGRMIPVAGDATALVAEFQSAVEAVRAAVDVQATLRARSKARPHPFRIAVAIGEVVDGEGDVPDETASAAARLIGLATPGGVSISRSVRDAVVSKLKLHALDLTVEGERPEPTSQHTLVQHRKPAARKPWLPATRSDLVRNAVPVVALVFSVAAIALWLSERMTAPGPPDAPRVTTLAPAPEAAVSKPKPKPVGGTLEFKPAHAPDPAAVLTAQRMLPQAWRECHGASADKAVEACRLLLDSGIAKGAELAEIHMWNGKALRDRHELEKALEAFSASIALAPESAVFSLRGNVHYDKGDWDKAIADYTDTIRLDPKNGEAFNNRAWTYYRAGRQAEALADANTAVRLLAKEAYVWDTRGHINAKLGNRDAAISDFRAALAIDPANAASKDGLASLGVN